VEAEVAEEQDTGEQVRRIDMKLDEQQKALAKTKEDIAPKQAELEAERDEAVTQLKILQDRRASEAQRIDKNSVRLYDRVRSRKPVRRKRWPLPSHYRQPCAVCWHCAATQIPQ